MTGNRYNAVFGAKLFVFLEFGYELLGIVSNHVA